MVRGRSQVAVLALSAVALAVGAAGCKRKPPPDQRIDDGWGYVRAELLRGEHCFAGRADYCITDPAFVDAAIQPRLDELYGGEMPLRRVHVEATARAAAIRYKRALVRPENVARVEELVADRYLHPVVRDDGDSVTVDMGVVPGTLRGNAFTATIGMVSSGVMESGEWAEDELRRTLARWANRYPEKRVVRVVVWVPWAGERASATRPGSGFGSYSVRFLRDSGVVTERDPNGDLRTTRRHVTLEDLDRAAPSLRFSALTPCRPSETAGPPDVDPPRVCPPDS